MKTLSATLLAAQKKPHRLPYVEAKVYDFEQGIKRLSWTRLYEGEEPDNHHGIAFDGNGDMHRIRADGSSLYYQKQTLPFGVPASFPLTFPFPLVDGPTLDQWTEIATDCSGPCAIAAYGAKVYIFYKTTANVLWKYYSHDYGQAWDDAQLIDIADVLSMAAAWKGTTSTVVCFTVTAIKISAVVLDTATQDTAEHYYNHALDTTYGIGATCRDSAFPIILAAKDIDAETEIVTYSLYATQLSAAYNFGALRLLLSAQDDVSTVFRYPDCHSPASPYDHEALQLTAVESYTGVTAYDRPLLAHLVKDTDWSSAVITEPKFFLDVSSLYGVRLMTDGSYWWLSKPDGVWRAPRPADSPLDLTKDIVALTQSVGAGLVPAHALRIELDNSKGQYNVGEGLVPSLINKRSEIVLELGYKTTAGNETSEAGTYWIDSWEYSSTPNQSLFTIRCLDGWGLMDRWAARYQMRWNKDEVNPKSVWQILYQLLARAGIKLTNTPAKPQSSAINNFYPDFTVNSSTQGTRALNKLLSFVPDKLVFRGQEAFIKNPLASEESCYSYGTDHVILSGKYTEAVTVSRARAIGRDDSDNRILEESLDWDLLALAIDQLEQDYDPNLQDATRAQERADALLRTRAQEAEPAVITIPTNVGQELLDVVEVTDERCGISEENYRVQAIRTDYDRRQGIYTQRLALCAP